MVKTLYRIFWNCPNVAKVNLETLIKIHFCYIWTVKKNPVEVIGHDERSEYAKWSKTRGVFFFILKIWHNVNLSNLKVHWRTNKSDYHTETKLKFATDFQTWQFLVTSKFWKVGLSIKQIISNVKKWNSTTFWLLCISFCNCFYWFQIKFKCTHFIGAQRFNIQQVVVTIHCRIQLWIYTVFFCPLLSKCK